MSFNIFNQNNNQAGANPFGQAQNQNTPFGQTQNQAGTNPFAQNQNQPQNNPFEQGQVGANPFGQPQQTTNCGQAVPFGQTSNSGQAVPFGQTSNNPFGSSDQTPSPFGQVQNQTSVSQQTPNFGQAVTANTTSVSGLNSSTVFPGSSSKSTGLDKSSSFVQMDLYEIIQKQVSKLEDNISDFNSKAREIFIEDEKIMKALNNYKAINSKLDTEEKKIAEIESSLENFEKMVEEFSTRVPASEDDDDLLSCIKKFEEISDFYNKSIESIKDEDDEVLGLVKENYNLCSLIDDKLDLYEKYQ